MYMQSHGLKSEPPKESQVPAFIFLLVLVIGLLWLAVKVGGN